MSTETAYIIDRTVVARVTEYGPKLVNICVTLTQEQFHDDGVCFPAQTIGIYGPGIKALRDILNELSPE